MNVIEAKTGKAYWRRIGLLWAMFGFFGLVMTATAKQPALGIFGLVMMVAPAWLLYRRRVCWLARMDSNGVTLLSGKRLPWSDFEKVVDVHAIRGGAQWHNHYELVFRSGRARVFDRMLANADQVVAVVKALEGGEDPLTAMRRQQA
jgi:hypothetical protein